MSTQSRCDLTELLVDQCAHCRGDGKQVADITVHMIGPIFVAKYPGRCEACDLPFAAGISIAALEDGSGYACAECLP